MRTHATILIVFITLTCANAQFVIPSKSSLDMHSGLKLEITTEKLKFSYGEDIVINYIITSTTDTIQRILHKEEWPHVMGLTISILDRNSESICEYSTKAVLSSQIYSEEELSEYHRYLEPGEMVCGRAIAQDIPIFKKHIVNDKIPPGSYSIQVSFFQVVSNTIKVKIKRTTGHNTV